MWSDEDYVKVFTNYLILITSTKYTLNAIESVYNNLVNKPWRSQISHKGSLLNATRIEENQHRTSLWKSPKYFLYCSKLALPSSDTVNLPHFWLIVSYLENQPPLKQPMVKSICKNVSHYCLFCLCKLKNCLFLSWFYRTPLHWSHHPLIMEQEDWINLSWNWHTWHTVYWHWIQAYNIGHKLSQKFQDTTSCAQKRLPLATMLFYMCWYCIILQILLLDRCWWCKKTCGRFTYVKMSVDYVSLQVLLNVH